MRKCFSEIYKKISLKIDFSFFPARGGLILQLFDPTGGDQLFGATAGPFSRVRFVRGSAPAVTTSQTVLHPSISQKS